MLKTIFAIARNTFKETIRDRVLYSLIGFAVIVIAASLLAASVSLGQETRVIQSFGLTAMLVFLLIITIFIGTQLVWREVERRTIYMVLSKPVSREAFYLGKFLGLCLTILVVMLIMGAVFVALVGYKTKAVSGVQIAAIVMMMVEAWLLTAVGMLFASFTSPLASAVYAFALALIGHSATSIYIIAAKSTGFAKYMLEAVYYAFPNLEKFNLRNEVIFNAPLDFSYFWTAMLYFVGYTAAMLLLGIAIVRKHEY
ncbi:MAG: ABC transporter permease subunit [Candidatus Berkelbacteria bacterium]|nr:MAG: ABC transporter permease subunit [Candidatus Berkelbacteria bacterium]QQG51896.1 MAG: ABC transporter permease subunit [Candidatus Berkelbacteria bacterium]